WRLVRGASPGGAAPWLLDEPGRWPVGRDETAWIQGMDMLGWLPDDVLAKVDRAAMSVGLETRAPFLDPRVAAFAAGLPLRLRVAGGRGKVLPRMLLARHLPPALTERPKMGFGAPVGAWLRGPLRAWAEALLDEKRLAREGWLEPGPVRRAWAAHCSGRRDLGWRLWAVCMFQAWLERWGARLARS
ncbi:MAG: asparagine synthase-related protein, partial [Desulfovibrionaceae bacterium]